MSPSRFSAAVGAVVGIVLLAGACDDLLGPRISDHDIPFYYAGGERVYLRADSSRVMVATISGDSSPLFEALENERIAFDSVHRFRVDHLHWTIRFGEPGVDSEGVARVLRLSPGIGFASPAYTLESGGTIRPLNYFIVGLKNDAELEDIEALNASLGVTKDRTRDNELYEFYRYPVDSPHTPLAIVTYYHERPFVEWAEPGLVSDVRVGGNRGSP